MSAQSCGDAFQTKTTLRRLLDEAGVAPRRRHGQHFLIDRNLMLKLLDSADLKQSDCVLEVGTGTGSLCDMLAERAGRVVTVEIDPRLAELARGRLCSHANVTLLNLDALKNKSTVAPELVSAIEVALTNSDGDLKLVANLPYNIATALVINLLLGDLRIARMCFTVQAEVADRFLAAPDGGDYGPVGIITQALTSVRRICTLGPQAFWPAPKVESAMLCIDLRDRSDVPIDDARGFAAFVRPFFTQRRKTIGHLLKRRDDAEVLLDAIERMGIEPRARPENLPIGAWADLYRAAR